MMQLNLCNKYLNLNKDLNNKNRSHLKKKKLILNPKKNSNILFLNQTLKFYWLSLKMLSTIGIVSFLAMKTTLSFF